jgi:pimeloyl-ACP methyl ester carboxylesterase
MAEMNMNATTPPVPAPSHDPASRRREFLRGALMAAAVAQIGASSALHAATKPSTRTAFGSYKQVQAGLLNVGYAEEGPTNGPVVILLHGWPYDIHSFLDSSAVLTSAGYRVIVPYLRGYGTTRFLSDQTTRNGQQSALGTDVVDLMDALGIRSALLAGFDWGARTAAVVAALWPDRCRALVSVSGYLITNLELNKQPLPPAAELGWWYQYYFATERGRVGYDRNRRDFAKLIWKIASPRWAFDDATFERSAAAFDNPDHTAIVVHNYRWRLGLATGEPRYDAIESRLQSAPVIAVPTITIGSDFDGAAADGKSYAAKFSGPYRHQTLNGIGHNVPQEAPEAFAAAIIEANGMVNEP